MKYLDWIVTPSENHSPNHHPPHLNEQFANEIVEGSHWSPPEHYLCSHFGLVPSRPLNGHFYTTNNCFILVLIVLR